jgi:hypothetical protein
MRGGRPVRRAAPLPRPKAPAAPQVREAPPPGGRGRPVADVSIPSRGPGADVGVPGAGVSVAEGGPRADVSGREAGVLVGGGVLRPQEGGALEGGVVCAASGELLSEGAWPEREGVLGMGGGKVGVGAGDLGTVPPTHSCTDAC